MVLQSLCPIPKDSVPNTLQGSIKLNFNKYYKDNLNRTCQEGCSEVIMSIIL